MKFFKNLLIFWLLFCVLSSFAQENNILNPRTSSFVEMSDSNNIIHMNDIISPNNITFECQTVFWTINFAGQIQQWDLLNDEITGGSVILSNGNASGISYSSLNGIDNFYFANYPQSGVLKYNVNEGWTTIDTPLILLNNGSYLNDHYFLTYNGFNLDKIYYYDGSNFNILEQLTSGSYRVADIAVDSLGRAWIFKKSSSSTFLTDSLNVYDSNGLVTSFPISINTNSCYGSFFIDDVLYLGFSDTAIPSFQNSILPIHIVGDNVELGNPISFPYNNFADMASCNVDSNLKINKIDEDSVILYPNPTMNIVNFSSNLPIDKVYVYDVYGKLIIKTLNINSIDLSQLNSGIYIVKIISNEIISNRRVIKE